MSITGRCLCGKVSYTLKQEPMATAVCHCRNCQRQAGSAFSIIIAALSDDIEIRGQVKTYDDTADSGRALRRQFCPECGSALFSQLVDDPQITYVKAGTLDDVSSLKPEFHVWCKSAQPWVQIDRSLPCFDENPPQS